MWKYAICLCWINHAYIKQESTGVGSGRSIVKEVGLTYEGLAKLGYA